MRGRLSRQLDEAVIETELIRGARAIKVVERTAGMLRAYKAGGIHTVTVEDVLTLLGEDPDTAPPPPQSTPADPLDDPVTGARWAGPPGTGPDRVQAAVLRARGGPAPANPQGFA